MKKFLIALSVILLLVIWYLLYMLKLTNDKLSVPVAWNSEIISQLENELTIKAGEISALQSENQQLKDTFSWTVESLNSLQLEKSELEKSLSWCENRVEIYAEYIKELREWNNSSIWDNTSNISNNSQPNNRTATTNWKEIWKIKQVYTDGNWNKKIEIDYGGQLTDWATCGVPESPICLVNENPKSGTFTVSNNAKIIMQTLSHTSEGYFNNGQVITFDYFKQKFNDTNNYEEYPHNYSNHFKQLLFWITIENGIVTEIEEQYIP